MRDSKVLFKGIKLCHRMIYGSILRDLLECLRIYRINERRALLFVLLVFASRFLQLLCIFSLGYTMTNWVERALIVLET